MTCTRWAFACAAALGVSLALPDTGTAQDQNKHVRQGFWFNIGLGYGTLGCQDCSGREGSLTGGLAMGGTLSQKVLIGVLIGGATTAWTNSSGASLTVGTLVAAIRFYPSATGGFFILGGLGVGTIGADITDFETGPAALVGVGYDIRVGRNLSITPFWNGFAVNTSNADANVGQLGVGVTIH